MKIGDLELAVGAPNAERLLALTGQRIEAMRDLLRSYLIAGTIARALAACSEEEHDLVDLAQKIAAEGVDAIRAEVLKLYEDVLDLEQKVTKRGKEKE